MKNLGMRIERLEGQRIKQEPREDVLSPLIPFFTREERDTVRFILARRLKEGAFSDDDLTKFHAIIQLAHQRHQSHEESANADQSGDFQARC